MARRASKCDACASDEERNDATGPKHPAEGEADRPLGSVAALARWFRIALLAASTRMNQSAAIKVIPVSPDPL